MPELEAVIGEDGALEAVTGFAKTIDELARRIESALQEALNRALVAAASGVRIIVLVRAPRDPTSDSLFVAARGRAAIYLRRRWPTATI